MVAMESGSDVGCGGEVVEVVDAMNRMLSVEQRGKEKEKENEKGVDRGVGASRVDQVVEGV